MIQLMNNVKAPYNVNKLTSDAAANALKNTHVLEKNVNEVLEQREEVARKLEGLAFVEKVYPSDANFLLFRVRKKANEVYKMVSTLRYNLVCYMWLYALRCVLFSLICSCNLRCTLDG